MEQSFFDLAKILVCDPIAANRAATRSALYALGCRQIEMVASLRDLCEALDQRHRQVTCELWDREALDEPGITLSRDGKRRLTPPPWQ